MIHENMYIQRQICLAYIFINKKMFVKFIPMDCSFFFKETYIYKKNISWFMKITFFNKYLSNVFDLFSLIAESRIDVN